MILRIAVFHGVVSIVACAASLVLAAGETIRVAELRCEYLVDPMGIDVVQPRLSWQIQSSDPARRGIRQSAYHILVASTEETLRANRGDLWDSGEVKSDQSTQVVFHGKPLAEPASLFLEGSRLGPRRSGVVVEQAWKVVDRPARAGGLEGPMDRRRAPSGPTQE